MQVLSTVRLEGRSPWLAAASSICLADQILSAGSGLIGREEVARITCSGEFVVNYGAKRVQWLENQGDHLTAVEQDGRPSKVKETCPACGGSIVAIDYLKHEVQWESREGQ